MQKGILNYYLFEDISIAQKSTDVCKIDINISFANANLIIVHNM